MPRNQSLYVSVRHENDSYWATVDEFPGYLDELRVSLEEGIALVQDHMDSRRRRSG
jgi:hypothetical protein